MLYGLFRVCTVWPGVREESVRQSPHSETLRDTPQSRCRPQRGRWSTQASGGLQCNFIFERLTFDNDRLSLYPDPLLEDTQPVSNFLEENLTMEELKEAFRSDIIKLKPGISFQYFLDCLTTLETATLPWINSEIFWSKLTVKYQRKS